MGLEMQILKYNVKKEDLEEYQGYYILPNNCEEICYWRKHFWLSRIFNYCNVVDEEILTKDKIKNVISKCNNLYNSGLSEILKQYEENDFYCLRGEEGFTNIQKIDLIKHEIFNVISDLTLLLTMDWDNNTFVYSN